jgi:hypothetical protein
LRGWKALTEKIDKLLLNGPNVLNIGLKSFSESIVAQGSNSIHINWTPPAQGDPELLLLLEKLL